MVRKSERVRARGDEPVENGDAPPPAPAIPAELQAMLAAMEARMLRAKEEARMYRRQAERQVPKAVLPPVQPPAPILPVAEANKRSRCSSVSGSTTIRLLRVTLIHW